MRSARNICATATAVVATLAMPLPLIAQEGQEHKQEHHHYKLVQIGTFGGPNSSNAWAGIGNKTLNSRGTVTGEGDTTASDPYCLVFCFLADAFQWDDGLATKLVGLPANANGTYADSINARGWVSGISGNGATDPLTGYPEMEAVLWEHGKIRELGTLGGNGSAAYAINDYGQVVGAALNEVPDPFSNGFPAAYCGSTLCISDGYFYGALFFPALTQTHAVLWQNGSIRDLGTLGGPDSVAWQINDRSQIAGQSYINSTPNATTGVPTIDPFFIGEDGEMVDLGNPLGGTVTWTTGLNNRGEVIGAMSVAGDTGWHPFLWSNGVIKDLGTLGADCGTPTAINDAGDVVGAACSPTSFFPVLWRKGVLINLGLVPGETCGEAYGINSSRQIVGESGVCGTGIPGLGWLWENGGPAIDLNTLIVPGSGIHFAHAVSINDRGEISGEGLLPNGDHRAALLIPCDESHGGVVDCDYGMVEVGAATSAVSTPITKPRSAASESNTSPIDLLRKHRDRLLRR
jgi:probable HAF family extracellular repeat protein